MKKEEITPDTVYYTTNLNTLIQVVDKTDEMKKSDMLKEEFIKLLGIYVANRSGLVLVSFKEDKETINGCMVISRHTDRRGQYLYIDFAWIDPEYPKLRKKFEEEIMTACKSRGIKRIQMRMNHGFKAMEKLYGTYEIGRILEKEVI
jgi:ribosomal protein S18 acetylase RimI-like enzyme